MSSLEIRRTDERVVITLARPEARNAITQAMVTELHAVLDELEREPRIAIVTGGDQGVFAGGADIAELRERGRDEALAAINLTVFERLRRLPMPTIAAVDGPALGGGAELAYACDIRIASDRAQFGQPEVRLGIMAAAGACHRLPKLVGESLAKEMLLAGRTLDAGEALRHGLVSRVVAPDELLATAGAMADQMGRASPMALRLTKLAVDSPPEAHPVVELLGQAVLFEDDEKRVRMTKFLERRRAGT